MHLLSEIRSRFIGHRKENTIGEDSENDEIVEELAGGNVDSGKPQFVPWLEQEE